MNHNTYKQLEFEPYVEHGVAKLRYKEPLTTEMFPEEAQDLAEALIKASKGNWLIHEIYLGIARRIFECVTREEVLQRLLV